MKKPSLTTVKVTTAMALTLVLAACGNSSDTPKATQVAAKVGGEEITVYQVNQLLQNTPTVEGQDPKVLSRAALERLIDQQLAINQAMEAKLHRSPEVVAQIESARREILARAYLQHIGSSVARPTAEEVEAYYRNNPALFAERRVFNLQELVVPLGPTAQAEPGLTAELRRLAQGTNGLAQAAQWLQSKNLPFAPGSATRAAEQLPLNALQVVHALADGQSTVLEAPNNLTVVQVVSSQRLPLAKTEALPRIEQFMLNQRTNEQVTAKLKELRTTSSITYQGEFAQAAASTAPNAAPEAATTPATPAAAPAAAVADAPSEPNAAQALEKGVAGLKR